MVTTQLSQVVSHNSGLNLELHCPSRVQRVGPHRRYVIDTQSRRTRFQQNHPSGQNEADFQDVRCVGTGRHRCR